VAVLEVAYLAFACERGISQQEANTLRRSR
jgi:hypothetical protein